MADKQNTDQELLSFIREARHFLKYVESPGWVGSAELADEDHVAELATSLSLSRERLGLPETTVMHSVRNTQTGLILALTGNTPDAAERARFLTGLMQALPRLLQAIEEFSDLTMRRF
jgi:hypothetical protein